MSALPRPDVTGPARILNDALHHLHHRAGWPSLRTLARETGVSHTTVSKAFSSSALPSWGTLELLVEAMDGDVAHFHDLWLDASVPIGEARATAPRIAGRRAELAAVRRHLETGTGLLLVTGEAGMGKTTLVAAAAETTGAFVAVGNCLPLSTEVPLLPIADCLRSVYDADAGASLGAAVASCPPYVAASLTALLPEAGRWTSSGVPLRPDDRQLLFTAVAAVLRALAAERPTSLLLEDLHWADPATLDLMEHLLGRSVPISVVGSWRSGDETTRTSAQEWFTRVRRLPGTTTIPLGLMTPEETTEQLRLLGVPVPDGLDIHARSLGQPLFTEQLAAHHHDGPGLPELLVDLLDRRLAGVSEESWTVLRLLGVAARPLRPSLLSEVIGLPPDRLTAELRGLQERRLLRSSGELVDLQHPLLAEAVTRRLVAGEEQAVHRLLAQALGGQAEAEAAEVAEHWRRAGDEASEIVWRFAAADAAGARLDRRTEADQCLRIIEIWPEAQDAAEGLPATLAGIYVRAMDSLRFSFRYDEAAALSEVAEKRMHEADVDDGVRADLLFRRAIHRGDAEGMQVGLALLDQTLALCAGLPVRETTLRALDRKRSQLEAAGRFEEARAVAAELVVAATELGDPALLRDSLMGVAWQAGIAGGSAGALALLASSSERAGAHDDPLGEIRRGVLSTDVLLACGAPVAEVLRAASAALDLARDQDIDNPQVMLVKANVTTALVRSGRIVEAEAFIDTSVTAPLDVDRWPLHASAAVIASRQGMPEEAFARIESLFVALPESAALDLELLADSGDVAHWARTQEQVRGRLLGSLGQLARTVPIRPTAPVFVVAARTVADLGSTSDATGLRQLAAEAGLLDDHVGDANLAAHRATFEAELARMDGSATVEHWTRPAASWDLLDRPHDAAYCRWRGAQVALRDGRGTVAARLLKKAAIDAREHVPLTEAIAGTASRSD